MCRISIIVPLYNGEKTIERCLKSLIEQELEDIEILVVDDGSIDSGVELVKKYIRRDNRIKLISQENQGQGAARNYGIQEAAGKYIGFVDCDDFVDSSMYRIMLEALESKDVSVAVCQEKNIYIENGDIQFIGETRFPNKEIEIYSSEKILEWQLNYTYMSLNSLCYKLIKRSVLLDKDIKVPEGHRHAEDMVASVGIFVNVDKVAVIPQSLYYYVHDKGSVSYDYSLKRAEDIYCDLQDIQKYIDGSGLEINLDNFALGTYFSSLKQIYWASKKEERKCERAIALKKQWRMVYKKNKWRPLFSGLSTPFAHRLKIYVVYFRLYRPVLAAMTKLSWIPFFKYMV